MLLGDPIHSAERGPTTGAGADPDPSGKIAGQGTSRRDAALGVETEATSRETVLRTETEAAAAAEEDAPGQEATQAATRASTVETEGAMATREEREAEADPSHPRDPVAEVEEAAETIEEEALLTDCQTQSD